MRFTTITAVALAAFLAALNTVYAQSKPLTIRMGWNNTPTSMVPIIFANKALLRHYGKSYTMEPVRFKGAPLQISALSRGDIDLGTFTPASLARAILNAKMTDVRIIGDELQDGVEGWHSTEFLVLKDGPIKTVEDLKGKILASNAIGSGLDLQIRAMLQRHHIDDKRDVTFVEASFPALVPMLEEHKVDLIGTVPPFSYLAEAKGNVRTLFTVKDVIGVSDVLFDVARTNFINKNRAVLVDFMEDWIRALHWFLDPKNHEQAVKILADFTKIPPQRLARWVFTRKDSYRDPDKRPDLKALQTTFDLQEKLGFQPGHVDAAHFVDTSIIDAAVKRIH